MKFLKIFSVYIVPILVLFVAFLSGMPSMKALLLEPKIVYEVLDQEVVGFDKNGGAGGFRIVNGEKSYPELNVSRIMVTNEANKVLTSDDYFSDFSFYLSKDSKVVFASVYRARAFVDREKIKINSNVFSFPGQFLNPGDSFFVTVYSEGEKPEFKLYSEIKNVSVFEEVKRKRLDYSKAFSVVAISIITAIVSSIGYAKLSSIYSYKIITFRLFWAPGLGCLTSIALAFKYSKPYLSSMFNDYGIGDSILALTWVVFLFIIPSVIVISRKSRLKESFDMEGSINRD